MNSPRPEPAEDLLVQAAQAFNSGQLDAAAGLCRQILASTPDHATAHLLLGVIAFHGQELDEARHLTSRALELKPDDPQAHHTLAGIARLQGRNDEALSHYRRALMLNPGYDEAYANLIQTELDLGDAAALGSARQWLQQRPDSAQAHAAMARACARFRRPEEHLRHLQKAVQLAPTHKGNLLALGNAWLARRHFEEARQAYEQAAALPPDDGTAEFNLAQLAYHRGDTEGAKGGFEQALEKNPRAADAWFGLALVELLTGELHGGWDHFRERPSLRGTGIPRPPIELDHDLTGRKVLVIADEGPGDELFFLRFAPALRRRGARITYQTTPLLQDLLRRIPALDSVVTERPADGFDLQFAVGDLPFLLGVDDMANVPEPLVLEPQAHRIKRWREDLRARGDGPLIGVTWRAGPDVEAADGGDRLLSKAIGIDDLVPYVDIPGATLVVLQRLPRADELAQLEQRFPGRVLDLNTLNNDLEDMLAVLTLLDDYVGVSNTNMHLRAGVGRSATVLIPHPPEWRWQTDGEHSEWFPRFRLVRQSPEGQWPKPRA